ncbi:putative F-box/LRR-repeat protein At5g02700 [Setaria italica]|uniref:putative F-box/LRR-repeat protein At5g02700 n=1 Tax=Setaria italica TaxID=4555 RepID=UPI000647CE24|nr:putative F-box/LRR-repeat protein At5g02700 [Setaria italica]
MEEEEEAVVRERRFGGGGWRSVDGTQRSTTGLQDQAVPCPCGSGSGSGCAVLVSAPGRDARWPHASTSYAVGGGGGGDRFSALPEGIIDHILSFLPAEDAVRSSVLSGLWRGDWAHAPALNLSDERHQGRFLAFARAVLSRYGAPDIPALNVAIGCESNLGPGTAAWLRDAMERAVGSISVSVTAPVPMDRLTLPRRLRAKSISLTLSSMYENADLVLPDEPCETVAFGSLVELNLSRARLQGGGGVSLGEFLSSCCPCLRLLRLSKWDTDNVVQISAPRLHNISWLGGLPGHLSFLTDCRCVQRLALGFKWTWSKYHAFLISGHSPCG